MEFTDTTMTMKLVHVEADIYVSDTDKKTGKEIGRTAMSNIVAAMELGVDFEGSDEFITISWDREPLTATLTHKEYEELARDINHLKLGFDSVPLRKLKDLLGKFE